MHSNGRLWSTAIIALVLGIVAGGAAMSISERGKVDKLQQSLATVMQRLEDSDREVKKLSDELNRQPVAGGSETSFVAPVQDQPKTTRRFAFITALSADAMSADYASYLTGAAAAKAASKAGEESPPPNDYFIVNDDEQPTKLKVDPSAVVKLTTRPGEGSVVGGYETDVATLAGYLSANTEETAPLRADGYWLTLKDGIVVAIEEQYAP